MSTPSPELILCDTSVASLLAAGQPTAHWSAAVRSRLEHSLKAISVVTIAEVRHGCLYARWGERRRNEIEARLAAYLAVPFDPTIVDRWADLRTRARRGGVAIGDNDLWIAATAIQRGWCLVSADRDHERLAALDGVELDLLVVRNAVS